MSAPSRRPILLVFALSGASALIYQVIWARELGLVFGNTTLSLSIVLAAFMAGLALGAALAGRALVGRAHPLRVFAALEASIGGYAILFPLLVRGMESLYPALFSDTSPPVLLVLFRALGCLSLLLVPTTLMGATLPVLTEALHRLGIRRDDWNAGRLYAANTLGAALGALASGFVLIELLGLRDTSRVATVFNLAAASIALVLGSGLSAMRASELPSSRPPERATTGVGILALFAVTGALALAGEVLWTRALTLVVGSSSYAFSSILIVYLLGIAAGSWLAAGLVRRMREPGVALPLALALSGAWSCIAVALFTAVHREAARLVSGPAGTATPATLGRVAALYASLLLVLLPPAFLSGALFPVVTRLLGGDEGDRGGPIARAYTWNTCGAIAGSLVAGFVIAPLAVHFHAIYVLVIGFAWASLASLGVVRTPGSSGARMLAVGIALVSAAFASWSLVRPDPELTLFRERHLGDVILSHQSGLQGVTTVVRSGAMPGRLDRLLVNGLGMTVKHTTTKEMAHLPLLAHGPAKETLVICFGMGTSYRSALAHGGHVDVVELVPEVFEAFPHYFVDAEAVRTNPRGRMIANDGRNHLLLTRKKYDVITIDPPPPIDGAGVNNLYSKEFLELVRDRLAPGGIVAHWIPSVHPLNGVPDAQTFQLLVATFVQVFPYVRVYGGSTGGALGLHLLGSTTPFTLDPERAQATLLEPAVAADLAEFPWAPFVPARFFQEIPISREELERLPPVTDDRPMLEFGLIRNARAGLLHTMLRFPP